ncbi:MAG TPA: Ig-like domain-containing protein [Gemmatimonadales bacterium]|nr:Ig-like domain-containing protein [Gemmatimonadales bacterium]
MTTRSPLGATYLTRGLAIVGVLLLGACPKSITDSGYVLTVTPPSASLAVDGSTRFTATLRDRDGKIVPTAFSWSADNQAVATVDSAGVVRAVAPGSTVIRVSTRGMIANASITVAADGQTLTVSPTAASVFVNATQRFTATLRDRNGTVIPSTPQWTSTDPSVATVDGSGVAQGKASGATTIQARVGDLVAGGTLTVSVRATSAVLVGAGDIAACAPSTGEATATLLDGIAGTVFTAGDNAYENGSAAEYANCYAPSWGRHKARTRPVPGNHEYQTFAAAGYFGYFGAAAGDPATGYYSYELGPWHIVALNSNVQMDAGSPQEQWLRADLAAHPTLCTLAYWHHPRFSSGLNHGSSTATQALWQALYDLGADVVISGHDHIYERFAPQAADGKLDLARGLREFVAGTGGAGLYQFGTIAANSEVRNNTTRGVLKLTLYADRYDWKFVPVAGSTFTDVGSASCH